MNSKIIGITGVARAGKSTAAAIIQRITNGHRDGIASPIRTLVRDAFGLSHDQAYGLEREQPIEGVRHACIVCRGTGIVLASEAPCSTCGATGLVPITAREAQQSLAEWGRDISNGRLWLDWWLRRADPVVLGGRDVIADDVRFVIEAEAIRARSGLVLRIRRREPEASAETWRMHSTEREVLSAEMSELVVDVENNGTIEELADQLLGIVARWA